MRGKMATGAQTRVPAGACRVALGSLVSSQADLLLIVCLFEIPAEVLPEKRHLCANETNPGKVSWGARRRKRAALAIEPRLGR